MTALRPAEARALADLIGRLEAYRRHIDHEPSPILESLGRLCATAGQVVIGPIGEEHSGRMPLALDLDRVAMELSISKRGVNRLIASGDLKAVKVGGLTRVLVDDLRAYLDALSTSIGGERRHIPTNEAGMETR